MRQFVRSLIVVATVLGAEARAGDLFRHCSPHCDTTRRVRCLPAYDYRGDNRKSSPATEVTFEATNLTSGNSESGAGIKTFALRANSLANDHCSISQVGITLEEETGRWTISFKARQDPMTLPEAERPIVERFKRNRFYVNIRVFGAYEVAGDPTLRNVGQPQLMELVVPPFWLDRGQEENGFYYAVSNDVTTYFDAANRIEVDLQYE